MAWEVAVMVQMVSVVGGQVSMLPGNLMVEAIQALVLLVAQMVLAVGDQLSTPTEDLTVEAALLLAAFEAPVG